MAAKPLPLVVRRKLEEDGFYPSIGGGTSNADGFPRQPAAFKGAIVGDIAGSVYEFRNIKTKEFPLFQDNSFFTDDTVMSVAVAEGMATGGAAAAFIAAFKKYGRLYPNAGYGWMFDKWLKSDSTEPYNSFGNGSAMRVSRIAERAQTLEEAERYGEISAAVTHNHPEGIKGAKAVAGAAFLAGQGKSKEEIKQYVSENYGYNLGRTLDEIRPAYKFDATCQGSVPEAIIAFLESTGFEDAIRNAVSLGGDSDTIAAIAGTIAGAAYGVPEEIWDSALQILDQELMCGWATY
jgi:ADP-ribosylglycohydrolase